MVAAGRLPMLKVSNFFSQIIIISYMRLKFQGLNIMDPQNMSKPIPYCSNLNKIVFWAWWGLNFIESKNFFYKKVFFWPKEHNSRCRDPKSKFCILSPPANDVHFAVDVAYLSMIWYDIQVFQDILSWPWCRMISILVRMLHVDHNLV